MEIRKSEFQQLLGRDSLSLPRKSGSQFCLASDVKPLGVGADPELDGFVGLGRNEFCFGLHGCEDGGIHSRLTIPCHQLV